MDGILMKELHGSLNLLSETNFKKLIRYFETGILSSQDRYLLQSEITRQKVILQEQRSQN